MKKILFTVAGILVFSSFNYGQAKIKLTPFLHQAGMYYTSDNITSDGFGFGLGLHVLHQSQIAGKADVNILWGNGNAITTRLAVGWERKGKWNPGIFGTINLVWGQRVEILAETGEKPPMPAWAIGARIVPLKFSTKHGYVSALECGYGFGPDNGRCIELSVLSIGLNF